MEETEQEMIEFEERLNSVKVKSFSIWWRILLLATILLVTIGGYLML